MASLAVKPMMPVRAAALPDRYPVLPITLADSFSVVAPRLTVNESAPDVGPVSPLTFITEVPWAAFEV